jgi:hypothetical protein
MIVPEICAIGVSFDKFEASSPYKIAEISQRAKATSFPGTGIQKGPVR